MGKLSVGEQPRGELSEKEKYILELKEKALEDEANRLITLAYHINPAIEWLK